MGLNAAKAKLGVQLANAMPDTVKFCEPRRRSGQNRCAGIHR